MPAREDILKFRHDIPEMRKNKGLSAVHLADALFENFTAYAAENWDYLTQAGNATAAQILAGTVRRNMDCGKLRNTLKEMFEKDLGLTGVTSVDLDNQNGNGYFIAKSELRCFDTKVTGNVGNLGSGSFELACLFSSHYFLRYGGKYYDPCLSAIYSNEEGPVYQKTKKVGTLANNLLVNGVPARFAGTGKATVILLGRQQDVPGFGNVWEIVTARDMKAVFTRDQLKLIKATPGTEGLFPSGMSFFGQKKLG